MSEKNIKVVYDKALIKRISKTMGVSEATARRWYKEFYLEKKEQ